MSEKNYTSGQVEEAAKQSCHCQEMAKSKFHLEHPPKEEKV